MTRYYEDPQTTLLLGDVREQLAALPAKSVHCIVTSPPYWGLRAYQLEPTVWGGDPACAHKLVAFAPKGEAYTGKTRWQHVAQEAQDSDLPVREVKEGAWQKLGHTQSAAAVKQGPNALIAQEQNEPRDYTSAICSLCGAWRGNLGLEPLHDCQAWARGEPPCSACYVCHIRTVAAALWRVLRDDGVFFLNIGDSYAGSGGAHAERHANPGLSNSWKRDGVPHWGDLGQPGNYLAQPGLKPLDKVGIPERVALALQADGWYWRSDIVWSKLNPMPASVSGPRWEQHRVKKGSKPAKQDGHPGSDSLPEGRHALGTAVWADCPGCPKCAPHNGLVLQWGNWRPTVAHEYVYMFTKSERYYCDQEAVRQEQQPVSLSRRDRADYREKAGWEHAYLGNPPLRLKRQSLPTRDREQHKNFSERWADNPVLAGANLRDVWELPTESFDWQLCLACGIVYTGAQFRRLPSVTIQRSEAGDEDTVTKTQKRCRCGESDAWHSHFAAFQEALVQRCIQAGTSEHGVCRECGAPWARVLERPRLPDDLRNRGEETKMSFHSQQLGGGQRLQDWYDEHPPHTLSWLPTCSCNAGGAVPATVLDPFVGSGTACLAARALGRYSIGIDASEPYLQMAVRRLPQLALV